MKGSKRGSKEGAKFIKPGDELLSHVLRRSTIAAGDFRFPVRDGMERIIPRHNRRAKQILQIW